MPVSKGIALAASLAVLLLSACQQSPPGRCDVHLDCKPGQECTSGVCVKLETTGQLGARCIRASDCVSWADCASEVCTLGAGRCGWDGDCSPWESCNLSTHACMTRPNGCPDAAACASWQACVSYQCQTAAGHCASNVDCAAWETCGGTHVCALMPGACGTGADCASWQTCVAHACALTPGQCGTGSDCQSWQTCDGTHTCVLTAGKCGTGADCAAWQTCNASHSCVLTPGKCGTGADCAAWQTCDGTNTCVLTPGKCGTGADCAGWEVCQADHTCARAPNGCAADSECSAWEVCSSFRCALGAGRCGSDADCFAPQYCVTDHRCSVPQLDPSQVLLWGRAQGSPALSTLDAPDRPIVGWSSYNIAGVVGPSGEFVWDDGHKIFRFVPDSYEWNALYQTWEYPSNPMANDEVLIWPANDMVSRWLMKSGTGEVVAEYADGWRNAAGLLQFTRPADRTLRAWNGNDYKLLDNDFQDELYVMDPTGVETRANIPMPAYGYVISRTHGDGFRAVVENPSTYDLELWSIDPSGVATLEGTYPPVGAYFARDGRATTLLDGAGALYQLGSSPGPSSSGVVIKRTVSTPALEVVYDEANAPPGVRYVTLYFATLVSGP